MRMHCSRCKPRHTCYRPGVPFTPAHVVAVLPAVRWASRLRLDPTCLVIGSMAPDFEYFARGELVSRISHTALGLVAWNLPATLVLAALWHWVVKQTAMVLVPRRWIGVFDQPWGGRVVGCAVSAVLGAATHLAWDAITHANTPVTNRVAALTDVYTLPVVGNMALHRVLQHASTVVGLGVIAWYLARRRAPGAPRVTSIGRARAVYAACIAAGLAAMAYRIHLKSLADPGSVISAGISGALAGIIAGSIAVRLTDARPSRARRAPEPGPR